jgi:hypothetical protein
MMRVLMVGAALAAMTAPAIAKDKPAAPSPLVAALGNCQKLSDSGARLACYDQAVPALVGAANSGDIRVVDRESVRQARRSLFGFSVPSFAFLGGGDDKDDAATKRLDSTIVNFSSIGNGFYRFTIADQNAVWESTESAMTRDAKFGEPVTITRSGIGGFWAKIANRRELRVKRIR